MGIMGILAVIAAPNYRSWMAQQELEQTWIQLRNHIEMARGYAQTHQTTVEICPVSREQLYAKQPVCSNNGDHWQSWIVRDVDDQQVLTRSNEIPDDTYISSGGRSRFVFNKRGGANGYNGTLALTNEKVSEGLQLKIAPDGRISSASIAPAP